MMIYLVCHQHCEMILVGNVSQGEPDTKVCVEEIGARVERVYVALALFCHSHLGCAISSMTSPELDSFGDEFRTIFDGPGDQFIGYEEYITEKHGSRCP